MVHQQGLSVDYWSNDNMLKEWSGWFAILIGIKYLTVFINFLGLSDEDSSSKYLDVTFGQNLIFEIAFSNSTVLQMPLVLFYTWHLVLQHQSLELKLHHWKCCLLFRGWLNCWNVSSKSMLYPELQLVADNNANLRLVWPH